MPQVADPVVGRIAELSAIDAALGDGHALLLSGEPGIGKTRLLHELTQRAAARGCLVLAGSASEFEDDLPFWIFVDALEEHVVGLDARRLDSLGDGVAAELAYVLPALVSRERAPGGTDQRYRAHGAVRALLERLAAKAPLVLVLDDIHWADAASVDLLAALLRRPPTGRVLLAMATRPRQAPDRLARALERAHRRGSLRCVDLEGLNREDSGELLGATVDNARADALFAESGGNPFYLEQLARATGGTGDAVALHGVDVPAAVLSSLGEELAGLGGGARRVLDGAAVAGDPFEPELAAAAANLDEAAASQSLDDLLAVGLVRATELPRRFRFRHPLVRRAVYESAPAAWRLGAHERCAATLAARGAPPAARAHHVEHAARAGDPAAVALLAEAAAAVFPRAPASAAQWFAAALRLLPDAAPPEQRTRLLMSYAGALAATGRLADSRDQLLAALELVPANAVAWWVALTVGCAGLEQLIGLHAEARGRLADALRRLPDRASPEAADLMMELAIADLFRTRYGSMQDWARRAYAVAQPLGDRPLAAAAATTLALADAFAGAEGTVDVEAAALVSAMSDEELARRPKAAAYLAAGDLYADRYEAAVTGAERALEVERATGHGHPTALTTRALAWIMQGRSADASQVLDAAIERIRGEDAAQGLAVYLVHRTLAALAVGDDDAALAFAEEGHEITRGLDEAYVSSWTRLALARALVETGDVARAEPLLDELPALPGGWPVMALELLARCRLAAGRIADAREAVALAESTAARIAAPMAAVWAGRAAAAVLIADGELAAAAQRARAAALGAERAGAVVEAAAARVLAARALAQAGDTDAAAAELERATIAFDACGAPRHRDAAEQELRRLGRRVQKRARPGSRDATGLDALTGRELEVAELVVDRHTNPEIAAVLFLSLKTVETHLRNIFRKLGVSSRVELARAIERARRDA